MLLTVLLFVAVLQCGAAANNQFRLWAGLAISEIWLNQHPPSCKTAKYLIYDGHPGGFGSEFHVVGAVLATAVEEKSVFLLGERNTYRYRNNLCSEKGSKTLECYIEPLSNCTFDDAIQVFETEIFKYSPISNISWTSYQDAKLLKAVKAYGTVLHWENISLDLQFGQTSKDCYLRWHKYLAKNNPIENKLLTNSSIVPHKTILALKHNLKIHKSEYLQIRSNWWNRLAVPSKFAAFLDKNSNLDKRNYYNWWRAISITYFFRPTADTLAMIDRLSNPILRAKHGRCVSTYVRHGDKHVEMKLLDFEEYANASLELYKDKRVFPEQPQGS
eukprot:gene34314-46029_t